MKKTLTTSLLSFAFLALSNIGLSNTAFANATGKKTYDRTCSACHANGMSGAPKFGDIVAWSSRITKGKQALYASAIHGKGAMPAKGGQSSITDEEIKRTVDYIINNSAKL